MPKRTRKPIEILPHKRTSGLFYVKGEYVADVKPDDGSHVLRKLGKDPLRARKLFDELKEELENRSRENPLLTDFLTDRFLPSQAGLKGFPFVQERAGVLDAMNACIDG